MNSALFLPKQLDKKTINIIIMPVLFFITFSSLYLVFYNIHLDMSTIVFKNPPLNCFAISLNVLGIRRFTVAGLAKQDQQP
jgi:hypothetical protein